MQVEMNYKKSTKNTHVYEAVGTAVPTLYIQKSMFTEGETADKITVTIEVAE